MVHATYELQFRERLDSERLWYYHAFCHVDLVQEKTEITCYINVEMFAEGFRTEVCFELQQVFFTVFYCKISTLTCVS